MFGIKRIPCVSVVGNLTYCGEPTFRRARDDNHVYVPVCKSCKDFEGEIIEVLFDYEIGINESLYSRELNPTYQRYEEVEFGNTCDYGCKVYENQMTGRRILAHNSAYGCKVVIDE